MRAGRSPDGELQPIWIPSQRGWRRGREANLSFYKGHHLPRLSQLVSEMYVKPWFSHIATAGTGALIAGVIFCTTPTGLRECLGSKCTNTVHPGPHSTAHHGFWRALLNQIVSWSLRCYDVKKGVAEAGLFSWTCPKVKRGLLVCSWINKRRTRGLKFKDSR